MVLHPNQSEDLKVFISTRESTCDECGENLGSKAWITLAGERGAYRQFVEQFARRVRELFPACPAGREFEIAEHACLKYSGRVGRSASAKSLDEEAVRLAVIAHIRHQETQYDRLLARGYERWDARHEVEEAVARAMKRWEAVG